MIETYLTLTAIYVFGVFIVSAISGALNSISNSSSTNKKLYDLPEYKKLRQLESMRSENGRHYVLTAYEGEHFIYWATVVNGYTHEHYQIQASSVDDLEKCILERFRRFELRDKRDF